MDVKYSVKQIWGDYAILLTDDGIENKLALALLPSEIFEGDVVIFNNFEYTIKK